MTEIPLTLSIECEAEVISREEMERRAAEQAKEEE